MGLRASLLVVVWVASAAGCASFFGLPETVPPPAPPAAAEDTAPVAPAPTAAPAPAPVEDPAAAAARVAEELAAVAARETAGFTREKKEFRGDLADPGAVRVPVRRGRCYKVLLVAAPPADIPADWAAPAVAVTWKEWDVQPPLALATTQSNGGFVTPETCPFASGQLAVRWQEPSAPERIAVGPYRLEVWSRAIPAGELKAQEEAALDARYGAACRACREEAAQCLTSGRSGCQRGLAACLKREGVPPKRCD